MGFLARVLGVRLDPPPAPTTGREIHVDGGGFEARVEAVLEAVRPALQADGGDIEIVAFAGRSVRVRLVGACVGCPSAALTLRFGIEKKLKDAVPGFEALIPE